MCYVLWKKNQINSSDVQVKNGNRGGEFGGRKTLLSKTDHPSQIKNEIIATPDVLIERKRGADDYENIVIDVKYKIVNDVPSRPDINQVMAYASSYKSKHAILVFPTTYSKTNKIGLECLGTFNGVGLFQYFIDLSNIDFPHEEKMFSDAVFSLFDVLF